MSGCADMISNPVHYIISINDFPFSLCLIHCRSHSQVCTLGLSESLTADSTLFPGYCSLLFNGDVVNHDEASPEKGRHVLLVSADALLPYSLTF